MSWPIDTYGTFTLGEYIEQELRPALDGVSENFDYDAMADWMVETGRIEWLGDFDHAHNHERIEAMHGQTDEEFWAKVAELDGEDA